MLSCKADTRSTRYQGLAARSAVVADVWAMAFVARTSAQKASQAARSSAGRS
jgi:hypothetical protein